MLPRTWLINLKITLDKTELKGLFSNLDYALLPCTTSLKPKNKNITRLKEAVNHRLNFNLYE